MSCCSIDGCERPVYCRGMCNGHYEHHRRHGLIEVYDRRNGTRNFIEDVEWLVSTGETHAETVAKRLGSSPSVVKRRLERNGRSDLIRQIRYATAEGRAL